TSQRKLQEIRRCFTRQPGESLLAWLSRCWVLGANMDIFLNSTEAKQLGSLSRDVAIDKRLGTRIGTCSLWRRLVSSVREAYPFEDDLIVYRDRWNDELEGIQYLTELTLVDILYWNSWDKRCIDNPGDAYCSWRAWEKFRKSAPPPYAKALSAIPWHRELKVKTLMDCVRDYTLNLSSLPQDSLSYGHTQPKECAASSDDPCTICHEELSRDSCELECGHEFHRECIRTWLQEHSSTCPICRVYAVLPTEVPKRPAWNNSKRYKARAWKRSGF
ncbi:DZIP3 ligase, partial [Ptilonorhynchus violaceus]|nr:DZIP3 ligase [Ptilonorhynchus violaceus]